MTFDKMDDHMAVGFMSHIFRFVDDQMAIVNGLIAKDMNQDHDSGLFGDAEYLTGIGFAVGQRYITSTCGMLDVNKQEALLLGPKLPNGTTYTSVINSAANYWKHSDEWNFDKLTEQQKKTYKDIESVGTTVSKDDVVVYNLFNDLGLKTFSNLAPILEEWSTAVMNWKNGRRA
jgi:hypothetical protein